MFYNNASAQIRVRLGVHFGLPRVYVPARIVVAAPGPVVYNEPVNYNGDEDYYYLPGVDAYYSVTDQCYFYNNGGAWVSAAYLPGAYRDYDWQNVRHYEVRAPRPYLHNDFYRTKFNGVAFNGRWNERVYDSRVNAPHHPENDRQHFARNDFNNRERYGRGDSRHGRS